jgi:hypothetical protein
MVRATSESADFFGAARVLWTERVTDQASVWTNYLILEGARLCDNLVAEAKAAMELEEQVEIEN